MSKPLQGRHFIDTQEWTRDELELVLATSADLKRKFYRDEPHALLRDRTLFMLFCEQSTRTRNSFEAGMTQLGGHAHDLTPGKAAGQPRRDGRGHGAGAQPHGPRHRHPQLRLGQGQRVHPQRGRHSAACRC